ncbi:methyltransferase, FxLD system [Actinosynnema sp. NPDC050436]|uniref:methyltransferase, FxLD system n=1 Tax=Actinosynnema sp. NPDC050436 TaxID=3155659 RepID=UPI003402144B
MTDSIRPSTATTAEHAPAAAVHLNERDDRAAADPEVLRRAMLDELRTLGVVRADGVVAAFRAVPRHLFAPEATLEQAYAATRSVVTKRGADGAASSSVSAPAIQAVMLEQADLRPGMRVLEISSGGYNAALLSEIVGSAGRVVSVDIDPEIVDRAGRLLAAAGYPRVRVVHGDAEHSVPGEEPFDRIVVTVGAWDLPPAWWEQLVEGGRIVVPLLMRGTTRTVALEKADGLLVDRDHQRAGFVAMQGLGAHEETFLSLADGDQVGLRVDGPADTDPALLAAALHAPKAEAWSGVEVGGTEPFDDLDLYLATRPGRFGLLQALQPAVEAKLVSRWARWGAPTFYSATGFAYRVTRRVTRRVPDTDRAEFGVFAHGPDAAHLADRVVDAIRAWDRGHRYTGRRAHITVHPAATPDQALPADGMVLDRHHARVVVTWPTVPDHATPSHTTSVTRTSTTACSTALQDSRWPSTASSNPRPTSDGTDASLSCDQVATRTS